MKLKNKKVSQTIYFYKRAFAAVFGSRSPNPDYVHDLRVYCRRLLAVLYLLETKSISGKIDFLEKHFHLILEHTSPIRDAFVFHKIISEIGKIEPKNEWFKLWQLQSKGSKAIIENHGPALAALKELSLLEKKKVDKKFRNLNDEVITKIKKISSHPTNKYLHKTRIKIKKLRYVHDIVGDFQIGTEMKVHKLCRECQSELGHLHDYQNILRSAKDLPEAVVKKLYRRKRQYKKGSIVALKKLLRVLK